MTSSGNTARAGDSDSQVIEFLVARYGEFVLVRPRFERQTLLLWLVPPLLLVGGGLALWVYTRRRVKDGEAGKALTAQEQARLAALLSAETPSKEP